MWLRGEFAQQLIRHWANEESSETDFDVEYEPLDLDDKSELRIHKKTQQYVPVVFISYKHGKFKKWIRRFVNDLKRVVNIKVLFDEDEVEPGEHWIDYMDRIKTEVSHLIFVITPELTSSADKKDGGVAYEYRMANILSQKKMLRILPILRAGSFDTLPPSELGKRCLDFRSEKNYKENMNRLVATILK